MLSYLLLLSVWVAQGISNSIQSAFLKELAPEPASDSPTLEATEDDSSHPIFTQTGWTWIDYPAYDPEEFYVINDDSKQKSSMVWDKYLYDYGYVICGFEVTKDRYKTRQCHSWGCEGREGLKDMKPIFCSKTNWNDRYVPPKNKDAEWEEYLCPSWYFVYGIWGAQSDYVPLNDFGFYCRSYYGDSNKNYILKYESWDENCSNSFHYYRSSWKRDFICGMKVKLGEYKGYKYDFTGVEGIALRMC